MATLKKFETEEPIDDTRTFQSKENHFPADQLLRKHGFTIHSRKNNEEAIWEKNHKQFTESGALLLITGY
jgi:hypothetical protein